MQSISSYIFSSRIYISCLCALITIITDSFGQITPPLLPAKQDSLEVFIVAPCMPKAFGCDRIKGTEAEQDACTKERLRSFFEDKLEYPQLAIKQGIEGRIPVRFTVEKDGYISHIKLKAYLGGGCYQEAKRLLDLLRKSCRFTPQRAHGRPLRIEFQTEIVFSLKQ